MPRFLACLALLAAVGQSALSQRAFAAETHTYDVVVYGGTSGGVAAAIQVARMGKTVVLIEPQKYIGGLTTAGLGATDIGNKAAIGGISREFYQNVKKHYRGDKAGGEDTQWTFEPSAALKILNDMLAGTKVKLVTGERLDLKKGVIKKDRAIDSIVMESGTIFRGKRFIDATYEGDLLAVAGVSYFVGREANAQYKETLNGVQTRNARSHQLLPGIDPYVVKGDKSSGLIAGIDPTGPGEEGAADKRVQAYNLRMCNTQVEANRIPFAKPEGYDEKQYELLFRNFEAGETRNPWNPIKMPNGKTDTNNNFGYSTDFIGQNYDYPNADYAAREKMYKEHVKYQAGLMWTLANHPRVPEKTRAYYSTWGNCKDEFKETNGWPYMLYVREARRMVSDYVMSQHNCQGRVEAEDSVGLAAYTMDSHNVQRYVDKNGHVRNEGDVQVGGFSPYTISYKSIVPKASECTNLLVPVCLSSTHIAFGSIRMEPVFMVLGQSAATAACQSIDDNVTVQEVDYGKLQTRLLADKQILKWTGPKLAPRNTDSIDPAKLPGIVLDDNKAKLTGEWVESHTTPGFVGTNYLVDLAHDSKEARDGSRKATFTVTIPKDGQYDVRLAYAPHTNRASNVPVTIEHADGKAEKQVNQRRSPDFGGAFVSLGKFRFEAAKPGVIVVSNEGANGFVVVDAVQLVPVEAEAKPK